MSNCELIDESLPCIIADASAVININGTGQAYDVLRAIPYTILVPRVVFWELEKGSKLGYKDYDALLLWEENGIVAPADMGPNGEVIFESLTSGSISATLDDGEAATLAITSERGATALVDEKKANRIASLLEPQVKTKTTAELLLSREVSFKLGIDGQRSAFESAIRHARMNIPGVLVDDVINLLGLDVAMTLSSLSRQIPK